jgi:hypothetical protein
MFAKLFLTQEGSDIVHGPFTPWLGNRSAHSLDHSSMECCVESFNGIDETSRHSVVEGIRILGNFGRDSLVQLLQKILSSVFRYTNVIVTYKIILISTGSVV